MGNRKELTEMTLAEILKLMRKSGAGMFQETIKDSHDKPLAAIIVVDGAEESQEILKAVEKASADW